MERLPCLAIVLRWSGSACSNLSNRPWFLLDGLKRAGLLASIPDGVLDTQSHACLSSAKPTDSSQPVQWQAQTGCSQGARIYTALQPSTSAAPCLSTVLFNLRRQRRSAHRLQAAPLNPQLHLFAHCERHASTASQSPHQQQQHQQLDHQHQQHHLQQQHESSQSQLQQQQQQQQYYKRPYQQHRRYWQWGQAQYHHHHKHPPEQSHHSHPDARFQQPRSQQTATRSHAPGQHHQLLQGQHHTRHHHETQQARHSQGQPQQSHHNQQQHISPGSAAQDQLSWNPVHVIGTHLLRAEEALASLHIAASSPKLRAKWIPHWKALQMVNKSLAGIEEKVTWAEPALELRQGHPPTKNAQVLCRVLQSAGSLMHRLKSLEDPLHFYQELKVLHRAVERFKRLLQGLGKESLPPCSETSEVLIDESVSKPDRPLSLRVAPFSLSVVPGESAPAEPLPPQPSPLVMASSPQSQQHPPQLNTPTSSRPIPAHPAPLQPCALPLQYPSQVSSQQLQSLRQALEGLVLSMPRYINWNMKPWLEAAIPSASPIHAVELAALYFKVFCTQGTDKIQQALTQKLIPWLTDLVHQAKKLPPSKEKCKAWMDTALWAESSEDAPHISPSPPISGPDLPSCLEPASDPKPTPLGRLVRAIVQTSGHFPQNQDMHHMEALSVQLASYLASSLTYKEACLVLEQGSSHPRMLKLHDVAMAAIPSASPTQALTLAVHCCTHKKCIHAKDAGIVQQALTQKLIPWLTELVDQAEKLPPSKEKHKIWMDTVLQPEADTGAPHVSGLSRSGPDLPAFLEQVLKFQPNPLSRLLLAINYICGHSPPSPRMQRMEVLSLELARCLHTSLTYRDACMVLERGTSAYPEMPQLRKVMLVQALQQLDQAQHHGELYLQWVMSSVAKLYNSPRARAVLPEAFACIDTGQVLAQSLQLFPSSSLSSARSSSCETRGQGTSSSKDFSSSASVSGSVMRMPDSLAARAALQAQLQQLAAALFLHTLFAIKQNMAAAQSPSSACKLGAAQTMLNMANALRDMDLLPLRQPQALRTMLASLSSLAHHFNTEELGALSRALCQVLPDWAPPLPPPGTVHLATGYAASAHSAPLPATSEVQQGDAEEAQHFVEHNRLSRSQQQGAPVVAQRSREPGLVANERQPVQDTGDSSAPRTVLPVGALAGMQQAQQQQDATTCLQQGRELEAQAAALWCTISDRLQVLLADPSKPKSTKVVCQVLHSLECAARTGPLLDDEAGTVLARNGVGSTINAGDAASSSSVPLAFIHATRAALPVLQALGGKQQVGAVWQPQGKQQELGADQQHQAEHTLHQRAPVASRPPLFHSGDATRLFRVLCSYLWHRSCWGEDAPASRTATQHAGGMEWLMEPGMDGSGRSRRKRASSSDGASSHLGRVGSNSCSGLASSSSSSSESGFGFSTSVGSRSTTHALELMQVLLPHMHTRISSQLQCQQTSVRLKMNRWAACVWCKEVAGLMQASALAAHALALPHWLPKPPLPPSSADQVHRADSTAESYVAPLVTQHAQPCSPCLPAPLTPPPFSAHQAGPNMRPPPPHRLPHLHFKMHPLPKHQVPATPTPMLLNVAEMASSGLQHYMLQHTLLPRQDEITPQALRAVVQAASSTQHLVPLFGLFSSATSLLMSQGFMDRIFRLKRSPKASCTPSQLMHLLRLLGSTWQQQQQWPHIFSFTPQSSPLQPNAPAQSLKSVPPYSPSFLQQPPLFAPHLGPPAQHQPHFTPSAQATTQDTCSHQQNARRMPAVRQQQPCWPVGALLWSTLPPSLPSMVLKALAEYVQELESMHQSLDQTAANLGNVEGRAALPEEVHTQGQQLVERIYWQQGGGPEVLGHHHLQDLLRLLQPHPLRASPSTCHLGAPQHAVQHHHWLSARVAALYPYHPLAYLQQPEHVQAVAQHMQTHRSLHGVAAGTLMELLADLASLHTQHQYMVFSSNNAISNTAFPSRSSSSDPVPGHFIKPMTSSTSTSATCSPAFGEGAASAGESSGSGESSSNKRSGGSSSDSSIGSSEESSTASRITGNSSSTTPMFLPLIEIVAEALLPALPDLPLPQLCALGQQAWSTLTATGASNAISASSSPGSTMSQGGPSNNSGPTASKASGSGGSRNAAGVSSHLHEVNAASPMWLGPQHGNGSGSAEVVYYHRLGDQSSMGFGTAPGSGLAALAGVHECIKNQLEDKMEELYLLDTDTISESLRCLVSARLCSPTLLAVAANALAWQLQEASHTTLATLLLTFLHARAQAVSSSSSSSSGGGMGDRQGGGRSGLVAEGLMAGEGDGMFGSGLFGFAELDQDGSEASDLESIDAFIRELLGLVEHCLDGLELGQVLELVMASRDLGPYQRRKLLKHAAKALQAKVGHIEPSALVQLMEAYSSASSFWNRSLFYAAAADIARRPLEFTADQLVRALHALYASGARFPQPFDDLVSALLKAPRNKENASTSSPAFTPPQPASATAFPFAHNFHNTPSIVNAAVPNTAASPFAAATGPSTATAHSSVLSPGMHTLSPPDTAASAAGNSSAAGLTLRHLQSIYSVLKAVEHPQASAFSQEFLQSSQMQHQTGIVEGTGMGSQSGKSGGYLFSGIAPT